MSDRHPHHLLMHTLATATAFGVADSSRISEARMVFRADPGAAPEAAPAEKTEAPKPAIVDKDAKKSGAISRMQEAIRQRNEEIKHTGVQLDPATEEHLKQYFQSSIDRFDEDHDGKINKDEAKKYSDAMADKAKQLIDEYAPKERVKKTKENVDKAAEKVKAPEAAGPPEDIKAIEGTLDLDKSHTAFGSLQNQNNTFQRSVSESIQGIQKFQAEVAEFEKAQEGWSLFPHLLHTSEGEAK